MDNQNKRIVLITGATGGLGTAMCKKLLTDGYHVVGNFRTQTKADEWQEKMQKEGLNIKLFKADVADFNDCGEMIKQIESEIGPIDTLVNNAGITRDGRFSKMSFEDWDAVLKSNLYSVFNCSRHVINGMMERKFGRIINISSVNGQRGQFGQAQPLKETKKLFFCKLTLEDGHLIITCRFIGGDCDERFEIISYSHERILLKKDNSEEQIAYTKISGPGPGMLEESILA
jgi:NAD(P)-dependent dehydrogenase (short-subunit alcohol dehydrogenase family)